MEQDELTGVLNRQAFYRHVRDYLDRHPAQALEIIRFDLDNFSTINDLMGVKAGDRLLREIGQGILNHVDDTADIQADDTAGKMPGDLVKQSLFLCA